MNKIITAIILTIFSNVAMANLFLYQKSDNSRGNDYTIIIDLVFILVYIFLWYRYLKNWSLGNPYYGAILPMLVTLLAFFYRELFVFIKSLLLYVS